MMTTSYSTEPLKVGTVVRIPNSGYRQAPGVISEYRGPLGPKGARIYGVFMGNDPESYIEVREDQLEVVSSPQ